MKKILLKKATVITIFCSLYSFYSVSAVLPEGFDKKVVLSLEKVAEIIDQENLILMAGKEAIHQAIQDVNISRSKLLPSLDLSLAQTRTKSVNVSNNPATRSYANRFDGNLNGSFELINARNIADFYVSKQQRDISKLDYNQLKEDVMFEALDSYFDYLQQLKQQEVIDAAIDRDTILAELALAQYNSGVASKIDVTRANGVLAKSQKERLQHEADLYAAESRLKKILNLPQDILFDIKDENEFDIVPLVDRQFPLSAILDRRYDVRSANKTLERNILANKAAIWDYFPTVALSGSWGYASRNFMESNNNENWSVGLTITMPLFDGFQILSNKAKTKSLVRAQEKVLAEIMDLAEEEYLTAVRNRRLSFNQIVYSQETVTLAQEELELAKAEFKQGLADNRNVSDAQARLATAEGDLYRNIYEYNLNRLAVAKFSGSVRSIFNK